jgi:hypothetical protein
MGWSCQLNGSTKQTGLSRAISIFASGHTGNCEPLGEICICSGVSDEQKINSGVGISVGVGRTFDGSRVIGDGDGTCRADGYRARTGGGRDRGGSRGWSDVAGDGRRDCGAIEVQRKVAVANESGGNGVNGVRNDGVPIVHALPGIMRRRRSNETKTPSVAPRSAAATDSVNDLCPSGRNRWRSH